MTTKKNDKLDAAQDSLHDLIRSLTPDENRYFKVLANRRSGDKIYISIFDAISKQANYDEEALKVLLKDNKVPTPLARIKHYLMEMVLRSLKMQHLESKTEWQVRSEIIVIQHLFNKGLYQLCLKRIDRALKQARAVFLYSAILDLNIIRTYVMGKLSFPEGLAALEEQLTEQNEVLGQYAKWAELTKLTYTIGGIQRLKGIAKVSGGPKDAESVWQENTLQPSKEDTLPVHLEYINAKMNFVFTKGDLEKYVELTKKYLQLLEEDENLINDNPVKRVNTYNSIAAVSAMTGQVEQAKEYTIKLRDLMSHKDKTVAIRAFEFINLNLFVKTISDGGYSAAVEELPEFLERFKKLRAYILPHRKVLFWWYVALVYFGIGKKNEAARYCTEIINLPEHLAYNDIQYYAMMVRALLHFEEGNWRILKSTSGSARRFGERQKLLQEGEKQLFKALERVGKRPENSKEQLDALLAAYPTELEHNKSTDFYRPDLKAWLLAVQAGTTYEAIVVDHKKDQENN